MPTIISGSLQVQQIMDNSGFIEVKLTENQLVTETDLILHIIDPKDIISLLNEIIQDLEPLHADHKVLLRSQIDLLKSKVKTLLPKHRNKRGLINAVGQVCNFLFGTMDDKDRIDIENHLNTVDSNLHNSITALNQQVKINKHFNQTFMNLRDTLYKNRYQMLDHLDHVDWAIKNLILLNAYHEQLFKLNTLTNQIEQIQDSVTTARNGIIHPGILTKDEIDNYQIDLNKLKYLRIGVIEYKNNLLVFVIKVPKTLITIQLKAIIPIPNNEFKEIDAFIEKIFEFANQTYSYEENKVLNELKLSKHCSILRNCNYIINNFTEIVTIDEDLILVKNSKNTNLQQNCDSRRVILNGNYLIQFGLCKLRIYNHYFENNKTVFYEKFTYPKTNVTFNFSKKITFDDIALTNEQNINEIVELKYHKKVSYVLLITFIVLSILIIITIVMLRNKFFTIVKGIRRDSNSKGGRVMYKSNIEDPPEVENKEASSVELPLFVFKT